MSSLQVQASLIVAGFQLFAVQEVIKAINNADRASEAAVGALAREPLYEPRQVIHPQPAYAPRDRIVLRPQVVPAPQYNYQCSPRVVRPPDVVPPVVIVPVDRSPDTLPMQPPWKVLPWEYPLQPAPPVKVVRVRPDMVNKGTLLDCFV